MSILLSFGRVELFLTLLGEIFAQRVFHILFWEEDVNALEVGIVGGHAVVLQAWDDVHALLRHILLREGNGHFLGAVVAEIDENDHVAFLNTSVDSSVVDGLDEFVGHTLVIAFLHGLYHIGGLFAHAIHYQVVAFLHTLPSLVTVHGVETSYNAGNSSIVGFTDLRNLLDETLT